MAIPGAGLVRPLDRDVLAGQCQDQEPDQRLVAEGIVLQGAVQRVRPKVTDHRVAAAGHIGAAACRRRRGVIVALGRSGVGALAGLRRFRGDGHPVGDSLHLARVRIEVVADDVALARLAVDALGLLG